MPLYEYECKNCKEKFEELVQSANSSKTPSCPSCGSNETEKKLSVFGSLGGSSSKAGCGRSGFT